MFLQAGTEYFNPDQAARRIRDQNPLVTEEDANSEAWEQGRRLLERAIRERLSFAFETTLGGRTITGLLETASDKRLEVRIWYVGLRSPELHIARVRRRVAAGGHDIPDVTIRQRYNSSRRNLVRLLPRLTELKVFDNSEEADPAAGGQPAPLLVLHVDRGRVKHRLDARELPIWARPVVREARRLFRG